MKKSRVSKLSQVRIIGGVWRSRKIHFVESPGLRPTPDRVRETLFNWLSQKIIGAYCLDLFAGSGALGFEALSRGAAHVMMVDEAYEVVCVLRENSVKLEATHLTIVQASVPTSAFTPPHWVDIVFLDPPFYQGLIATSCVWLEAQAWLAPDALIYIEAEVQLRPLPIPPNWEIVKEKQAGQVMYYLIKRRPILEGPSYQARIS